MSLITGYLNQEVVLERQGALNRFGEPTFTQATLPARVQIGMQLVRTSEGEQQMSDATIFLEPDVSPAPQPRDRVVFEGDRYQVLAVATRQGLTAPSHLVLYVGRSGG